MYSRVSRNREKSQGLNTDKKPKIRIVRVVIALSLQSHSKVLNVVAWVLVLRYIQKSQERARSKTGINATI